eukprot:273028_1
MKAIHYISTNVAKKCKACDDETMRNTNVHHYGIKAGTPIGIDNLISVILYTDFTQLSRAFGTTFRPIPFSRRSKKSVVTKSTLSTKSGQTFSTESGQTFSTQQKEAIKQFAKDKGVSLSVFDENEGICTGDVKSCSIMHRISSVLALYTLLSQQGDFSSKLHVFITGVYSYQALLDDYTHLSHRHSGDLEEVNDLFIKEHGLKCLGYCPSFHSRHNVRGKTNNPLSDLYEETINSMHVYCLHQFDWGYRVKKTDKKSKQLKDKGVNMDEKDFATQCLIPIDEELKQLKIKQQKGLRDIEGFHRIVNETKLIKYIEEEDEVKTFNDKELTKEFVIETLESMKRRNQEFWWMSKILRETVEIFGSNGFGRKPTNDEKKIDGRNVDKLKGPFYTGVSFLAYIPQFNIRLCAPISTSTALEVATRFSGNNGIVLQLNNDGDKAGSTYLSAFHTAWLSKYKEEAEVLFFGGNYRIRVCSIRRMDTAANYQNFQHAFFWFDCMLTGSFMMKGKSNDVVTKFDTKIISGLIEKRLKEKKHGLEEKSDDDNSDNKKHKSYYDDYVLDTFHLFCNEKKCIVINLDYVSKYFTKSKMHELIMNSVEKDSKDSEECAQLIKENPENTYFKRNLCKEDIMILFPNLQKLVIYCVAREDRFESYSISFAKLLNLINKSKHTEFKVEVKAEFRATQYNEHSWLWDTWESTDINRFIKLYKDCKWKLPKKLERTKNFRQKDEDCVRICRYNTST